ncbi:MAG: hypothetical protein AB4372_10710 [Xenococcus sp. (in: cyanobacteria)]
MSDSDQAIQDIYQKVISPLSVSDRIQLAALILNSITEKNIEVIESSDTWTEQDLIDITSFSLQHAASLYSDEEEIICRKFSY